MSATTGRRPRVGVISTAQTDLLPAWFEAQHIDLISRVVQDALKGCGLRIEDVDFVIDSGSDVLDGRSISNCGFLGAMGAHHKEESRVEDDGLWAAMYGVNKIASGSADVGLIIAYSKPSESDVPSYYATMADPFCQRPVGLDDVVASGLLARSYMEQHRFDEEGFGRIAARAWERARANNPRVDGSIRPELAEVMRSRVVASPLRELMMARPVDGAVALVLASEKFARRANQQPVWVTGMGTAMDSSIFAMREGQFSACESAARMAFRNAGTDASRIRLAEVSATSAVGELLTVEALGLAGKGRGIDVYDSGKVELNPSGGALPANPIMATGLVRLAETAEYLWAQPQAPAGGQRHSTALVHGSSGIASQSHCVFVVEV